MQKSCSNCEANANYSVVLITSTVGISKRLQQSSVSVPFCAECYREFCERICSDVLRNAVNNAYTAIKEQLSERSMARKPTRD